MLLSAFIGSHCAEEKDARTLRGEQSPSLYRLSVCVRRVLRGLNVQSGCVRPAPELKLVSPIPVPDRFKSVFEIRTQSRAESVLLFCAEVEQRDYRTIAFR